MQRRQFLASLAVAATAMATRNAWASSDGKRCTLLHVTDTHAQLESHPEYLPGEEPMFQRLGGFARLKRAIDLQRDEAAGPVFLVDGGDLVHGSAPAAWSKGEVMIAPANALGLDAFVPGNWEPVYGSAQFEHLMSELRMPVLAYNLHRKATGARLFAPSVTILRDGVKITFVGITDPTTTERQPPAQVEGLDSTRMGGFREFLQDLRRKERPDLLVAVTHCGLAISRQLARENPELDVILSGHTHERTFTAIKEGHCLVVEAGSNGSFLGRLDLVLKKDGGIEEHTFRLIPVSQTLFGEDAGVRKLVESVLAPYRGRMSQVLCHTEVPIFRYDVLETNADNAITDALREATGADIALSNGFRFAPPIVAGVVTEADLWNLLPMDGRIKKGWVTGRQLKAYLERELELVFSRDPWKQSGGWGPRPSGLALVFEAHRPPGQRVRQIEVNGAALQAEGRYSIASCEREGEPLDIICRLRGALDVAYVEQSIHSAMRCYFNSHRVIAPGRTGRSRATDLPAQVFSQEQVLAMETR